MALRVLTISASVSLGASITLEERSQNFLSREELERGTFTADVSNEVHEELQGLAMSLLSPTTIEGQASLHESLRAISGKMDLKSAAKAIAHKKLPASVTSLVNSAASGTRTEFDEASMSKARVALNGLVETAWEELDDKIIECKEYQEMNRATFDQVTTDISRLVEQITDLERVESEAVEGISKTEMEIQAVEDELSKETKIYNYNYAKNSEELTKRQNDLDVFQFILTITRCPDATSLLQKSHVNVNETRICAIKGQGHAMCFHDHGTQYKFNQMMSKSSKHSISQILEAVEGGRLTSFLQDTQAPTTTANPALAAAMSAEVAPVAGGDEPLPKGFVPAPFCCEAYGVSCGPAGGGIMCSPEPPDCGLLHDKLSLMWGSYKDKVDELTMEMNKNAFLFEELQITLNDQIKILVNSKARFSMLLSEARSNLAADREEVKAKQQQKTELERVFIAEMKKCCERVKWIMFQDMCALIVVRNAVLNHQLSAPETRLLTATWTIGLASSAPSSVMILARQFQMQVKSTSAAVGKKSTARLWSSQMLVDWLALHCPALKNATKRSAQSIAKCLNGQVGPSAPPIARVVSGLTRAVSWSNPRMVVCLATPTRKPRLATPRLATATALSPAGHLGLLVQLHAVAVCSHVPSMF